MPNSPQTVRQQAARRLAPLTAPGRRKCVRAAGKSLNGGRGLHPSMPVGHDPEDRVRDRYEYGLPVTPDRAKDNFGLDLRWPGPVVGLRQVTTQNTK